MPFLNKNDPAQRQRLSQLFLDSNIFLFPTLADAASIVLAEASAYGLPILANDTGGLSCVVNNGVNGYLVRSNTGEEYASHILELVNNKEKYSELVKSSRDLYEQKLNWDAWAQAVRFFINAVANLSRGGAL
jgi:glycosyltransferase involved in cell wall biosynthesis